MEPREGLMICQRVGSNDIRHCDIELSELMTSHNAQAIFFWIGLARLTKSWLKPILVKRCWILLDPTKNVLTIETYCAIPVVAPYHINICLPIVMIRYMTGQSLTLWGASRTATVKMRGPMLAHCMIMVR